MNKQRLIASFWLFLLFVSGLIVGMVFSPASANSAGQSSVSEKRLLLPEQHWARNHRELLTSELDLTGEQLERIGPVYERSEERLREVRETMAGSIKEVVRENRRGLMEILTPEQIQQFKAIQEDARADR